MFYSVYYGVVIALFLYGIWCSDCVVALCDSISSVCVLGCDCHFGVILFVCVCVMLVCVVVICVCVCLGSDCASCVCVCISYVLLGF